MVSIAYTCHLKLIVTNGKTETSFEDIGFGNGSAGNTAHGIGSCIELATKEAVTDSFKGCLRYYGSKFGLSLYDKDDDSVMPQIEIEKAKIVTDEQMVKLRDLYIDRDIDDKWVLTAMKAENYPHDTLELMRVDWYELALKITTNYKLDEIERAFYDDDIENVLSLLSESATFNMAKSLFSEAWTKTQKYADKKRQLKAQTIYEEMKTKFEGK